MSGMNLTTTSTAYTHIFVVHRNSIHPANATAGYNLFCRYLADGFSVSFAHNCSERMPELMARSPVIALRANSRLLNVQARAFRV